MLAEIQACMKDRIAATTAGSLQSGFVDRQLSRITGGPTRDPILYQGLDFRSTIASDSTRFRLS